jgi:hypothetical protein
MLNQIRGSNVFLQADLEAMLCAILQTPSQMAAACPNEPTLQAWCAGYLAACQAIATMTGADLSPKTRRGADEARARGER